jgi:lipopolysaccharide transport system permease protein
MTPDKARTVPPGTGSIHQPSRGVISLSVDLPEEPIFKIRPHKTWAAIDFREVWAHGELFFLLIWRDLKLRYQQTILGALWVILQPLTMTLVFTIFLGLLGHPPTRNIPYPLFLYAGLLPWTFFSSALLAGSYSLMTNADLVRKTYFPRVILPAAAVLVRLPDFIISFAALLLLMTYYNIYPSMAILILPLIVLNLLLLATALGTWVSAFNIRYGDVGTALPVVLQLWMFASPIVYPANLVPRKWELIYHLNPLAGIIEGFRAALFGLEFNWRSLFTSFAVTLLLFVYVSFSFQRMEDELADTV